MSEKPEKPKRRFTRGCCVVGCESRVSKDKTIHFYNFPNKPYETEKKKKWIAAVRRVTQEGKPWVPTKHSIICSKHFLGGAKSNNPAMEAYNPTIFPDCYKKRTYHDSARVERAVSRGQPEESRNINFVDINDFASTSNWSVKIESTSELEEPYQKDIQIQTDPCNFIKEDFPPTIFCCLNPATCEAQTQTNIADRTKQQNVKIILKESSKKADTREASCGPNSPITEGFYGYPDIKDDKSMKALCGISSECFQMLLQLVQPTLLKQLNIDQTLSAENLLVLFLMGMRLGFGFSVLSCIFNIPDTTVSRIFCDILDTLYHKTKTWVSWPSREAIQDRFPKLFQKYPNCRASIDCTEIETDAPLKMEYDEQTYFSYKSQCTIKFLIAISPPGLVTFVSKGYAGCSTVEFITSDSGFLNLLEADDLIIADRHFADIQSEFSKRDCMLEMPQFTEKEFIEGQINASVCTHAQKAIDRVKLFKILNNITIECFPYIDKIMHVACALANNNKEPLISNVKT